MQIGDQVSKQATIGISLSFFAWYDLSMLIWKLELGMAKSRKIIEGILI